MKSVWWKHFKWHHASPSRNVLGFLFLLYTLHSTLAKELHGKNGSVCNIDEHEGITLVSFRWKEIGVYFSITAFVIIAGFAKLGFHKLHWLSSKVPESCLLVILGLAMSTLIFFTTRNNTDATDSCVVTFQFPQFTSEAFFFILLPPIILDSAYSLHDRVFLDNLGTVLVFAVIGTLFNVFAIGGTLYAVNYGGLIPNMDLTLTDAFVFSSLISAVDPVAVLAIFQELGVNQNLYFLIFGESLLNDGVTVVLYNTMKVFRQMTVITVGQCFLAVLSFFVVSFGGILVGIFFGLFTSIVTKWTDSVRVVEPLAMLGLAYLSYLTAELFHFSGIICLIVCGLIQAHFGFYNISQKSYICVKYFTKMASATSDTIIFMFLGMVLVNVNHQWNTAFVLWSLLFCFIYRFIAVFVLSAMTNIYRAKAIGLQEQFIAAYGGLRGAVAFSLANTLDDEMKERNTYIFTTLVVILFTIFIQGITIKPLVHLLKIKKKNLDKKNLVEEISDTSMDHMMAGIEEILGHHGDFYLRELLMHYNEKYMKKWFLHDAGESKLTKLFEKIALSEHYAHLYGPMGMVESQMKPLVPLFPPALDENKSSPIAVRILEEEIQHRIPSSIVRGQHASSFSSSCRKSAPRPGRPSSSSSSFSSSSVMPLTTYSPSPQQGGDHSNHKHILRRAFRDNKYNKLHCTYNRNLVDEEDQEMINHLNRRSVKAAQRMSSSFPSNGRQTSSNDPENVLPGRIHSPGHTTNTLESASELLVLQERQNSTSMPKQKRVQSATTGKEFRAEENMNETLAGTSSSVEQKRNDEQKENIKHMEEQIPLLQVSPLSEKQETKN